MPYTGSTITIDRELAEDIYTKVRSYSMMKDKPENGGYFEELFESGIIGYFKKSLMEVYGNTVNMDVLSALEREAKYEQNEYDQGRIEQYVRKVISETRGLSNPFIERPLGTEGAHRGLHLQQKPGSQGRLPQIRADRQGAWQLRRKPGRGYSA